MAEQKSKRAAQRRQIDVHQPHELEYWSRKFGVSGQQLSDAIELAGPIVDDVERELLKNKVRRVSKFAL